MSGDGMADRMYAADLGGQLLRFDIYNGEANILNFVTGGVIAQLGAEGLAGTPSAADTRRFYTSPDVSVFNSERLDRRYIGISIGSGYRAHPLDNSAADRFYSVRDPNVFNRLTQIEYNNLTVITPADLVEISGQTQVELAVDDAGWMFTLPANQKVLSDSITFNNEVFFVAFSPDTLNVAECSVGAGSNFLYRMSIINGDPVVNNLDTLDPADSDDARRQLLAQGGIAPTPTVLFPSPDDPTCTGHDCAPPPVMCIGAECSQPFPPQPPVRTLWTQDGIQ
jgi:type IV pilus assembly protein PilY1